MYALGFLSMEQEYFERVKGSSVPLLSQLILRSMFYVMWNAWKEQNGRTFNEITFTIVLDVVYLVKEDVDQRWLALTLDMKFTFFFFFSFLSFFLSPCNIFVLLYSMSLC